MTTQHPHLSLVPSTPVTLTLPGEKDSMEAYTADLHPSLAPITDDAFLTGASVEPFSYFGAF